MITLCITRLLRRRAPCIVTQHLLDCTIVCYTILSYSTIEKTLKHHRKGVARKKKEHTRNSLCLLSPVSEDPGLQVFRVAAEVLSASFGAWQTPWRSKEYTVNYDSYDPTKGHLRSRHPASLLCAPLLVFFDPCTALPPSPAHPTQAIATVRQSCPPSPTLGPKPYISTILHPQRTPKTKKKKAES